MGSTKGTQGKPTAMVVADLIPEDSPLLLRLLEGDVLLQKSNPQFEEILPGNLVRRIASSHFYHGLVNLGFTPHRESAAGRTEITLITRLQCRRLLEVIPNSEHLWHKFDVEADKVQLTYSKDQLNQLDRKYDKTTDPQGATKELGAILVRCIYGYLMAADVLLSQGLRELVDLMMDDLRPVESEGPGLPTYKALLESSARICGCIVPAEGPRESCGHVPDRIPCGD